MGQSGSKSNAAHDEITPDDRIWWSNISLAWLSSHHDDGFPALALVGVFADVEPPGSGHVRLSPPQIRVKVVAEDQAVAQSVRTELDQMACLESGIFYI